jgi:hypothetical protein
MPPLSFQAAFTATCAGCRVTRPQQTSGSLHPLLTSTPTPCCCCCCHCCCCCPRLVIACVGPFRLYGEPVFKACAEAGTDYVDICGEPGVCLPACLPRVHVLACFATQNRCACWHVYEHRQCVCGVCAKHSLGEQVASSDKQSTGQSTRAGSVAEVAGTASRGLC